MTFGCLKPSLTTLDPDIRLFIKQQCLFKNIDVEILTEICFLKAPEPETEV